VPGLVRIALALEPRANPIPDFDGTARSRMYADDSDQGIIMVPPNAAELVAIILVERNQRLRVHQRKRVTEE
jgi:hypothetical protein